MLQLQFREDLPKAAPFRCSDRRGRNLLTPPRPAPGEAAGFLPGRPNTIQNGVLFNYMRFILFMILKDWLDGSTGSDLQALAHISNISLDG